MPGLVTILGPTASGKSSLGHRLAEQYRGEIMCADSRTIYQGLDIGTAKPTQKDQQSIPYHLLDVCLPTDRFSAKDFVDQASQCLQRIQDHSNQPFLVGGSGMYIDALLFNYQFRDAISAIQSQDLSGSTLEELWEMTNVQYGVYPAESDRRNRRRLEDFLHRGPAPKSDRRRLAIPGAVVGLDPGPEVIKKSIAQRTDMMLLAGFVDEVVELRRTYGVDAVALHSTGYRQVGDFLEGIIQQDELPQAINQATWQLARKQMTWFRRNQFIEWFDESEKAYAHIATYLQA